MTTTLVAQREPRQRHQTGFFTAGAAPPPSVLHAAARRAQAEDLAKQGLAHGFVGNCGAQTYSTMDMQLSYDQQTIDAGLIDECSLQPLVLALDISKKYALVRCGNGAQTGAPEGCVLLVVNDPKVSSCHLVLEFVRTGNATGSWMLTDGNGSKRSTNGVLVNQQRVHDQPIALTAGSLITVKSSKVALHLDLTPGAQAKVDAAAAAEVEAAEAASRQVEAVERKREREPVESEPMAAAGLPAAEGSKEEPDCFGAAPSETSTNGPNQLTPRFAGALRFASPRPRGLAALEGRWRAAAEPEEPPPRRIEATVVPHHLYTDPRGVMSVLRQWGRCTSSPAGAPSTSQHVTPTTVGLGPTARLAPKRPRPVALRPWSPVAAQPASAHPAR